MGSSRAFVKNSARKNIGYPALAPPATWFRSPLLIFHLAVLTNHSRGQRTSVLPSFFRLSLRTLPFFLQVHTTRLRSMGGGDCHQDAPPAFDVTGSSIRRRPLRDINALPIWIDFRYVLTRHSCVVSLLLSHAKIIPYSSLIP